MTKWKYRDFQLVNSLRMKSLQNSNSPWCFLFCTSDICSNSHHPIMAKVLIPFRRQGKGKSIVLHPTVLTKTKTRLCHLSLVTVDRLQSNSYYNEVSFTWKRSVRESLYQPPMGSTLHQDILWLISKVDIDWLLLPEFLIVTVCFTTDFRDTSTLAYHNSTFGQDLASTFMDTRLNIPNSTTMILFCSVDGPMSMNSILHGYITTTIIGHSWIR